MRSERIQPSPRERQPASADRAQLPQPSAAGCWRARSCWSRRAAGVCRGPAGRGRGRDPRAGDLDPESAQPDRERDRLALGGTGRGIAKLAVGAFDAIIKALFAPIAKFITTELIGWLIAVPNLTQGNVAQLEQTVEAMGGGLLGAVATISTIRYWAAGFAGGGDSGFAALEGLARTVAAALFLALWPWLFDTAVSLTNLFTGSLLGSGAVVHSVLDLLAAGLGAGIALNFTPIGLFLDIAIAVAASLLFLGLLLVKIVVSISTILVFVGMPLAVVAWPVVPWIARAAMRAFAVCLLVPVLWALCFAAAAAVSLNAISFNAASAC